MCCLHVDDLFVTGNDIFLKQFKEIVKSQFKIGHEDTNDLMFTGQRVSWKMQEKTKKKEYISVEQSLCVQELTEIIIPKGLKDEDKCDKDMHTAFRSLLGSINWLQSRTQFQACYQFSRSASASAGPTIGDCKALNKLCKQIATDPMELRFWPLEGSPRLLAMPDAAFRNNSDKPSQRAMVIFMGEQRKAKQKNTRGSLIFFESSKIKRTTLSATVAELYAFMKCYGTFPSEGPKMEVDQEEAKEESTPHFLSREIGEDSAASYLPSGEKDANLEDTSGQRKSKKSRLNKIPDPHFHEEVQDDATLEEKKKAVKKIREVREDDGEKKLEAEIQESFPSEVVVDKDPVDANNTYELHTSPLRLLGELTEVPGICIYQLCFRETHARLLNHVCFRKGEISHPHFQSRINEDDFVRSIRKVCPVPPPDCYEHDSEHDLKRFFINDDRISYLDGKYQVDPKALEKAEHAREELEDTKKELKKELESYGPNGPNWDFVTFYEELCRRFLKGRIEEQYGTNLLASSESLTFLSWNYGNMVRGQKYTTPRFLQGLDSAMRPRKQSAMSLQYEQFENNLFFNMLFFLRAHVVILQEAHLLVPAKEFIEQKNWTVCFNDWENLAAMARLAPGGYVKIIAGHDQDLGHCEQRDVTWAIYEICFGKTRPRQEFKDADFEFDDYGPEDQRVPLTRANMHTIRVCNYHVDTHRAVDAHSTTGEQTALMLYECFVYEVDIISGDANSLAYRMSGYKRQPMANYYYSTTQHWIRRFSEARVKADPGIKAPIPRTFYSSSSLVLKQCEDYFDKLWEDYSTVEKEEY